MKLDKQVFQRWISWADKIEEDLRELVNNQQIFREFSDTVQTNWKHIDANQGSLFCYFVRTCYAVQAAVGIRRHLKINKDSVSLLQLIYQISKCALQFTYDFYISQYPIDESYVNWQESTFSQFSHDGRVVAKDIIDADLKTIYELGTQIESYVDCQLAHLDRNNWDGQVTYDDLGKMIEQFNELTCKYLSLITAKGLLTLEPAIAYDWKSIFRVPLDVQIQENPNKSLEADAG